LVKATGTIVDDGNDARAGPSYLTAGYDLAGGFIVEITGGVIVFVIGDAILVSITGTFYAVGNAIAVSINPVAEGAGDGLACLKVDGGCPRTDNPEGVVGASFHTGQVC